MPTDAIALRKILDWIDHVPGDFPLPAMPGFERDWVESLIEGRMEGWPPLSFENAIDMAMEWVNAIPAGLLAQLPPFESPVSSAHGLTESAHCTKS